MNKSKACGGHALRIAVGITLLVLTAGLGQANPQPSVNVATIGSPGIISGGLIPFVGELRDFSFTNLAPVDVNAANLAALDVSGASGEVLITTDTANQAFPAISGKRIVYEDNRNGNWNIYMYNLSTNTEKQITTNTAIQGEPAISGKRIVWMDYRYADWDIYMYDLSTPLPTLPTPLPTLQPIPTLPTP